jgi:two-component system chemotaxis response regulator CheB
MDFDMPGMNGAETSRAVMEKYPTPILIVTGLSQSKHKYIQFESLKAGAVDMLSKTGLVGSMQNASAKDAFLRKLKLISEVPVFKKHSIRSDRPEHHEQRPIEKISLEKKGYKILAMGASTGGPVALQILLKSIPKTFPLPIVLIQHIGDEFVDGFVEWLGKGLALPVCKGSHKAMLNPGVVYVAPEKSHMTITPHLSIHLDYSPPINSCRPSVDQLFLSIAQNIKELAIGVLLTGMGQDGAMGLKAMHSQGALTIIQDEATSVVFGMPKAAYHLNAHRYMLPLEKIANQIQSAL